MKICFATIVHWQPTSCIENASQGDGATMIIILPRGDVTGRPFFFHGALVSRVRRSSEILNTMKMIYERETLSGIFYCRRRAVANDTRADNLRTLVIMSKWSTGGTSVFRVTIILQNLPMSTYFRYGTVNLKLKRRSYDTTNVKVSYIRSVIYMNLYSPESN